MNKSLLHLTLQHHPLFKTLTTIEFETILGEITFMKFPKNTAIYNLGDDMNFVYVIDKGSVKLGMKSASGHPLTKDIAYESELFGENIFSSSPSYQESAETMVDTTVFAIPVSIFKQNVVSNHHFAEYVMNTVVSKLNKLEDRLQNFVFRKAKERIIDFICKTGKRKGQTIGISETLINHGMTHTEISYLTDTSRQTVARILNDLKKENLIHFSSRKSGKILVRDIDALHTLAYAY